MYKQAPLEFRYAVNILILFGGGERRGVRANNRPSYQVSKEVFLIKREYV